MPIVDFRVQLVGAHVVNRQLAIANRQSLFDAKSWIEFPFAGFLAGGCLSSSSRYVLKTSSAILTFKDLQIQTRQFTEANVHC